MAYNPYLPIGYNNYPQSNSYPQSTTESKYIIDMGSG